MNTIAKEVKTVRIEDELQQSYLDYAMSVIVGRALPDVRDGLKPVHRRVLYAMHEMNNDWNKPYKKSARIVGDVIGKYHPHGDSAVYDAIVRMAQPFSLRNMLVDGQGNFGSVDGDAPAAMRYTEVRMAKIAHELLADLEKDTVDFTPNYDENEFEPTVLPAKFPNLLVNGSSGIAVGMATNIPPHNLSEVLDACLLLIDNPDATFDELYAKLPGPDFPTAAMINGRHGILQAYQTGRGKILLRSRTEIEGEEGDKQAIIVTELPYQVNKARLIEKIAELVKEKRIEGITALRDESDKDGMRVVIELRRGEVAQVVLNNLYSHTQLQYSYGINMVALVDGQPRQLPLKTILDAFILHRRKVVTRRTQFDLKKARARAHILEGLAIALENIDPIIALIKAAQTPQEAKDQLLAKAWRAGNIIKLIKGSGDDALTLPDGLPEQYGLKDTDYFLSPEQAQAILELRLHRLTGLEQEKIVTEYQTIVELIKDLLDILHSHERLMSEIRKELEEIKENYGDARRTEIIESQHDLTVEDLIAEESVVVTLSHEGYAKYQPVEQYQAQHRGGKGKIATTMKSEDFVEHLIIANTHDTILCFSSRGKVYWLKVYQLPLGARTARGKPIVNLLPLEKGESINAILPINTFEQEKFVVMSTSKGVIKKTKLQDFSRPRSSGIIAVNLQEDDCLVGVGLTDGECDVMLFTNEGKVIRFHESDIRVMGRMAQGVRGIRMADSSSMISMIIADSEGHILTATQNGFGKRTPVAEYRTQSRGGKGIISIQVNERNGDVVSAVQVQDEDQAMLVSDHGKLVRIRVNEVSVIGRNTKGVKLINLNPDENLVAVAKVQDVDDESEGEAEE